MLLSLNGNFSLQANATLGGENWIEQLTTFPSNAKTLNVMLISDEIIYVGSNYTLYKSTDYGQTWASILYVPGIDFDGLYVTSNDVVLCFITGLSIIHWIKVQHGKTQLDG